jgi:hypothetical protein
VLLSGFASLWAVLIPAEPAGHGGFFASHAPASRDPPSLFREWGPDSSVSNQNYRINEDNLAPWFNIPFLQQKERTVCCITMIKSASAKTLLYLKAFGWVRLSGVWSLAWSPFVLQGNQRMCALCNDTFWGFSCRFARQQMRPSSAAH